MVIEQCFVLPLRYLATMREIPGLKEGSLNRCWGGFEPPIGCPLSAAPPSLFAGLPLVLPPLQEH